MRNRLIISIISAITIIFMVGCGPTRPSEEDVMQAVDAAIRAFGASLNQDHMEVQNMYSNAADVSFVSGDESLVHHMSIVFDENDGDKVSGECHIKNYQDLLTNYLINGSFDYEVTYPKGQRHRDGYGTMNFNLELEGGNIHTLEWFLVENKHKQLEELTVIANGMEMDMNKMTGLKNIFRYLSPEGFK